MGPRVKALPRRTKMLFLISSSWPFPIPTQGGNKYPIFQSFLNYLFFTSLEGDLMAGNDNIQQFSSSNHHRRKSAAAIKVVDIVSTEWTDKKHSLYLDSMEAYFVNQLYECHSKDLVGWLSKSQTYTKRSRSHPENQTLGQVLNRNFCELGRPKGEDDIHNESHPLFENQWIHHFRPHALSKEQHDSPANEVEKNELASQSIQLMDNSHGRQATILKKQAEFVNRRYRQVSLGSMTEKSDQNFVDTEAERVEKFSRRNSRKRARPSISPATDQVVPFVGQGLDVETKGNGEECTSRNLEIAAA